uniref:BTB domain-containing protein n=1 Tax=Scleropages formosus TaxID=113540 RepID=A0A8C9T5T2_SCLFO
MVRNVDDLDLCLSSHPQTILEGLRSFCSHPKLIDLTLSVNGREFPCHRSVLALCSLYFRSMFCGDFVESIAAKVELHDVDPDVFSSLLDFAYTGKLTINQENVEGLIRTSSQLQFQAVRAVCSRYLQNQIDATNCLGILEFGEIHGCPEVVAKAWGFLRENFESVIHGEEFLTLEKDRLVACLSAEGLQTRDECTRVEAVLSWVRHQEGSRLPCLPELLSLTHLSLLPHEYITEILLKDSAVLLSRSAREVVESSCREILDLHPGALVQRSSQSPQPNLQEVLFVMGGRSLDDSDDEGDEEEEGRPQRILPRNCAFYNTKSRQWHLLPDFPNYNKWGYSVVSLNNDVYVTGGSRGSSTQTWSTTETWKYITREGKWVTVAPMLRPRTNHTSAALNGEIYVIGGTTMDCVEVEHYDPYSDSWSVIGPALKYVTNFTASACKGKLYLIGSCAVKYNVLTLQCYNPVIDGWSIIYSPFIPKYLSSPRSVSLDGVIYLIADNTKKVYCYDPEANMWEKKLAESLVHSGSSGEETSLMLSEEGPCPSAVPIPVCIHQIATHNLAEQPPVPGEGMQRVSLQDENGLLKGPVSQTHMDQDQLLVKQTALSDRVEQLLEVQSCNVAGDGTPMEHRRLMEVERTYKQKLQAYQEGQQRQAQLVQRLQAKVLQYKKRCGELEEEVLERTSECGRLKLSLQAHLDTSAGHLRRLEQEYSMDLQSRICQREEEQRRSASLGQVNTMLRKQLEQASAANSSLIERLRRAQDEADQKDMQLRREQETCVSRLSRKQARVRALWRQTASLRNCFTQLRASADRSLSDMRIECVAVSHRLYAACKSLEDRLSLHSAPNGQEVSLLEKQLKDKLKEAMQLQAHWGAEKVELNSRILDLTSTVMQLQGKITEKDRDLTSLKSTLERMEKSKAKCCSEMEELRREISNLQQTLNSVTQLACGDSGASEDAIEGLDSHHPSPTHQQSSPCLSYSDRALMVVQNTLSQYKLQVQELHTQLENTQKQMATLHRQLQEGEAERKDIMQRAEQLQQERQHSERAFEESYRDAQGYRSSLDIMASEKGDLEKLVLSLNQQIDSQRVELEALRSGDLELRRQQDLLLQQQEELRRESEHWRAEAERRESSLEQLEDKYSNLRKELLVLKENLSHVTLQKEMLEDEKASLSQTISKVSGADGLLGHNQSVELHLGSYRQSVERDEEVRYMGILWQVNQNSGRSILSV